MRQSKDLEGLDELRIEGAGWGCFEEEGSENLKTVNLTSVNKDPPLKQALLQEPKDHGEYNNNSFEPYNLITEAENMPCSKDKEPKVDQTKSSVTSRPPVEHGQKLEKVQEFSIKSQTFDQDDDDVHSTSTQLSKSERKRQRKKLNKKLSLGFDKNLLPSSVSMVDSFKASSSKGTTNNGISGSPKQSKHKKEKGKSKAPQPSASKKGSDEWEDYPTSFENCKSKPLPRGHHDGPLDSRSRINRLASRSRATTSSSSSVVNEPISKSFDRHDGPLDSRSRINKLASRSKTTTSSVFHDEPTPESFDHYDKPLDSRSRINMLANRSNDATTVDEPVPEGFNRTLRVVQVPEDGPGYVKVSSSERKPFQRAKPREDPSSREYNRGAASHTSPLIGHDDEFDCYDENDHHLGPAASEFSWNVAPDPQPAKISEPTKIPELRSTENTRRQTWNAQSQDARFSGVNHDESMSANDINGRKHFHEENPSYERRRDSIPSVDIEQQLKQQQQSHDQTAPSTFITCPHCHSSFAYQTTLC